jgi:peptide/nickel transport system permease protein
MRFTDMQLAFPFLLLALALVSILGPGIFNVILVLALTSWIHYAKVIRGDVLQIRNREYIQAAVALGIPNRRIILRHILPNVFSSFLVVASFQVAALIIAESSLSYLGLGVPTSVPTWGSMLADGREYVTDAWWLSVLPGLGIMLAALSFNVLGDGLRDIMDPTQRSSKRRRPQSAEGNATTQTELSGAYDLSSSRSDETAHARGSAPAARIQPPALNAQGESYGN